MCFFNGESPCETMTAIPVAGHCAQYEDNGWRPRDFANMTRIGALNSFVWCYMTNCTHIDFKAYALTGCIVDTRPLAITLANVRGWVIRSINTIRYYDVGCVT